MSGIVEAAMQVERLEETGSELRCLDDSGLLDEVAFLIARTRVVTLRRVDEELERYKLKRHEYAALALVCTEYGPTQRELASFLKLDPSRLVAILDELEGRGLVLREQDPRDRRSRIIRATSAGMDLRAEAAAAVRVVDAELLGTMSNADRENLVRLLRCIAFPSP